MAEVLFFYHPAVWFVANCVRTERENCCDDVATTLVGGDPLRLAHALTALAEWSQSAVVPAAPRLALAALGQRGALLNRVRRLVQRRPAAPTLAEGLLAGALVLGGLGLLGSSVALAEPLAQSVRTAKPVAFDWQTGPAAKMAAAADTNKSTSSAKRPPAPVVMPPQAVDEATPADPAMSEDVEALAVGSLDGADLGSAFPGEPGTVVITKDKKGRLTELLVNGQRIATEGSKGGKKRKGDQSTEVIRTMPAFAVEALSVGVPDPDGRVRQRLRLPAGAQMGYAYPFARLSAGPGGDARLAQLDTLHGAEQSLRQALAAKSLSAAERREIQQELARVHAQLWEAQREAASADEPRDDDDAADELRDRQQELLDQQRELQDRIRETQQELRNLARDQAQADRAQEQAARGQEQAARGREQAARGREQAARGREQAARGREQADRGRERTDALVRAMQQDGLLKDANHYHIRLTAKRLVVDGKEQPQAVFQKYLKLHESSVGHPLKEGDVMEITHDSDSNTIIDHDGPTPPRPPRAPRAPRAPSTAAVGLPAPPPPPAAPAPPALAPETLREELRKDGLVGAHDKGYQLQLSNSGLIVNGKKQPDSLAAKYRKLTGHADGKAFNITISSQE